MRFVFYALAQLSVMIGWINHSRALYWYGAATGFLLSGTALMIYHYWKQFAKRERQGSQETK